MNKAVLKSQGVCPVFFSTYKWQKKAFEIEPILIFPLFFAIVLSPMPLTLTSSFALLNGPCVSRYFTISCAFLSPTPFNEAAISSALALLIFTGSANTLNDKNINNTVVG